MKDIQNILGIYTRKIDMKIHQLLPTISYGDAVSNDTIAIHQLIKSMGFKGNIYAENIGKRVSSEIKHFSKLTKDLSPNDIVIYHKSTGTQLTKLFAGLKCKKIVRYHNITPAHFFNRYCRISFDLTKRGRNDLPFLVDRCDMAIADSDYNKAELLGLGFEKVKTCPILISFNDYEKAYDKDTFKQMRDGKTNIIFTGRITPNKRQEDIIKSFYYYKKHINDNSRLILAGNYEGMESYYAELIALVDYLGLDDVIFTGHISFSKILAYYRAADVFLCMSEHEGFCVPLVEAMYFNLPIIAYNSTAIPYTLNGSGVLIHKKDYMVIAETINEVITNEQLKNELINNQKKRLKDFSNKKVCECIKQTIKEVMG